MDYDGANLILVHPLIITNHSSDILNLCHLWIPFRPQHAHIDGIYILAVAAAPDMLAQTALLHEPTGAAGTQDGLFAFEHLSSLPASSGCRKTGQRQPLPNGGLVGLRRRIPRGHVLALQFHLDALHAFQLAERAFDRVGAAVTLYIRAMQFQDCHCVLLGCQASEILYSLAPPLHQAVSRRA